MGLEGGKVDNCSPLGRVGAPETGAVAPGLYVVGSGDVVSGVVVVPIGMVPIVTEALVGAEPAATVEEACDEEAPETVCRFANIRSVSVTRAGASPYLRLSSAR